jgi:hypothetical protein
MEGRCVMTAAAIAAMAGMAASAPAYAATRVITFNPAAGEFPEGMALDHHGKHVRVSLAARRDP